MLIILGAVGWFLWNHLTPPVQFDAVTAESSRTSKPAQTIDTPSIPTTKLPRIPATLTVGETTYEGVQYRRHDAAFLTISHNIGVARINIADLPDDLKRGLGYDIEAASAAIRDEHRKRSAAEVAAAARTQVAITERTQAQVKQAYDTEIKRAKKVLSEKKIKTNFMVLQIVDGGVITARILSSDRNFVSGLDTSLLVDESVLTDVTLYLCGTYSYIDTAGARRTVPHFSVDLDSAARYLVESYKTKQN